MNAETIMILAGIIVLSITAFVGLEALMITNWRGLSRSGRSTFSSGHADPTSGQREGWSSCYAACAAKFPSDSNLRSSCESACGSGSLLDRGRLASLIAPEPSLL